MTSIDAKYGDMIMDAHAPTGSVAGKREFRPYEMSFGHEKVQINLLQAHTHEEDLIHGFLLNWV